jgi:hypothetical protein
MSNPIEEQNKSDITRPRNINRINKSKKKKKSNMVDNDEKLTEEEEKKIAKELWRESQRAIERERQLMEETRKKKEKRLKIINKRKVIDMQKEIQEKKEETTRIEKEIKSKIATDMIDVGSSFNKEKRIEFTKKIIEQNIIILEIIKYIEKLINISSEHSHIYKTMIANSIKGIISVIHDESELDMGELMVLHEYVCSNPPKNINQKTKYIDSIGRYLVVDRNDTLLHLLRNNLKNIYDIHIL